MEIIFTPLVLTCPICGGSKSKGRVLCVKCARQFNPNRGDARNIIEKTEKAFQNFDKRYNGIFTELAIG